VKDPAKAGDTRWVHRPKMKWEWLTETHAEAETRRRIFKSLQQLIAHRKNQPALAGLSMELIPTDNPSVLGYLRQHEGNRMIVLANFSEGSHEISANRLRTAGLGRFFEDLITSETIGTSGPVTLAPYQYMWLKRV